MIWASLCQGGKEMADKAKYWTGVLYPENMIENWESDIGDLLQVPYCYCIHDKDLANEEKEQRKIHVHLVIVFPNTTTKKHALEVMQTLGVKSINTCQSVNNIRHMYNYLIHDTEECKKKKKHRYSENERICGNNFDIGCFEQLSQEEKDDLLYELEDMLLDEKISNYMVFFRRASEKGKEYRKIVSSHSGHFYRLIQGNAFYGKCTKKYED